MALNDPLHSIDTVNIETEAPVIPWQFKDFDGVEARNQHERALGDRDVLLLDLIKALKNHGGANVSAQYPFTDPATLKPSQAIALDNVGAIMADFIVDPAPLKLSTSFLADLKLILTNEFREPFLSGLVLRKALDPHTALVQVFVDLEISARYTGDQQDHVILVLNSKAFNDVQDNATPSSRDNLSLTMTMVPVAGREWLNSGIVRFGFVGSVQSTLATSWSVGLHSNAMVEGFSTLPTLDIIAFTFTRPATVITELAYNLLGDLQTAIPFLNKIKNFPFDLSATAGQILTKYFPGSEITAPGVKKIFIKRIRITGSDYKVLFAYNDRDSLGNYLGTVNIGIATITPTSSIKIPITSLGSNRDAGVSPSWLDEVPVINTLDNFGIGTLTVKSYVAMADLFAELLATPISIGSPSPIDVSPVMPVTVVGLFADPNMIEMIEDNAFMDALTVDVQASRIAIYDRPLGVGHATKNIQITMDNVLINRRTCYGQEGIMRDFYGIPSTDSLVDNVNIPLEDEWFDTVTNTLKRYQIVQGKRKWRTL